MRANDFKAQRDRRASASTKKIEKELIKAEKRKKNFTQSDQLSRLQKYEELDKKNKYYKPFQGDPGFRGPKSKRKTTDRAFIPLFIIFNALFFVYAIIAWKDGVFDRLSRGLDFRGEICGVGKLASRPYVYYANPVLDINVKFCVESCPTYSGSLICLYDQDPEEMTPFCYTQIQSITSGRYCLPVEPVNKRIVDQDLSSPGNLLRKAAADISQGGDVIVAGSVISIVLAFLFFELMRRQTKLKIVVWVSIVGCALFLFASAVLFRWEYVQTIEARCLLGVDKYNCGGLSAAFYKVLTFVMLALGILYIIFVIKMRKQMWLGLRLVQLAGEVLSHMMTVRFIPFILIATSIAVGIIFITCLALAFSIGSIGVVDAVNIDGDKVNIIEWNLPMRILAIFFYLLFQWWINLILLIADAIVSYAISIWFFEKKKETVVIDFKKITRILFRRHIGTIALLAICKLIFKIQATFLESLRKTLRKARQHSNFVRFWQACCLCCVHVHHNFYRFISKHALIQTCVWSDSFKPASQKAFFLLRRHQEKVKGMDTVSTYILFQTKFFCGLIGGILVFGYFFMFKKSILGRDLSGIDSYAVPGAVAVALGFFYATTFQGLFDIAIKAVTQCYLLDTEMFVGDQKYVVPWVRDFMESYRIEANKKEIKVQEVKDKLAAKGGKIVPGMFIEHIDADDDKKDGDHSGLYSEETSKSGSNESGEDESDEEEGSDEEGSEEEGSDEEDEDEDEEDEDEDEEDEEEEEADDRTNRTSNSQHKLMQSQLSVKVHKGNESTAKSVKKKEESEEEEEESEEDDDDEEDEEEEQ